jgi:hypothetical protein
MAKTVFVDGNPALGVVGTVVDAAFLNSIFQSRPDGANQDGSLPICYAPDTGAANACVIALTPALTAHVPGMPIFFKAAHANTGASTININGLGSVALVHMDGSPIIANDIAAGGMYCAVYSGTAYCLLIPNLSDSFSTFNAVTGSRTSGVIYTNSTGKPMFVTVDFVSAGPSNLVLNVNGEAGSQMQLPSSGANATLYAMVPAGANYELIVADYAITINGWAETY